jgi:hypothetical protein
VNLCVFSHIAAGALVGALSPTTYLAPVFGLSSHVVLDVVPHADIDNMKLEMFLGTIAFLVIIVGGVGSPPVILGAVFGVLPDIENLLWKLGKIRDDQKIFPGHNDVFIKHGRETGVWSLYLQAFVSVAILSFLIWRGA